MSATAALLTIYDRILASIGSAQDLTDESIVALFQLFDENLIQALYLVDRGAVRLAQPPTPDEKTQPASFLLAEVQSRHPEPTRFVHFSPQAATSTMHGWCECAEFALVSGGARGSSTGPHTLPLPVLGDAARATTEGLPLKHSKSSSNA
ncbi:hypothetical protein A4X09_0g2292 [Tilletia walkeri]|uniref:Uncharacterized protein n=1 Tax=Tilletia walkeri TaxID=117179 RepID=A0A8X7NDK7_9BASI|nr:hypothetical protein A4X09_0g2292 [Tilletia walkeri]